MANQNHKRQIKIGEIKRKQILLGSENRGGNQNHQIFGVENVWRWQCKYNQILDIFLKYIFRAATAGRSATSICYTTIQDML